MKNYHAPVKVNQKQAAPRLSSYVLGYVLCVFLTISAYILVSHHDFTVRWLVAFVATFALIQFVVQVLLFLHLRQESGPRWKLGVFFFMLIVVGVLVGGSLWIMFSLNYRMTPQQVTNYMNNQSEDGL